MLTYRLWILRREGNIWSPKARQSHIELVLLDSSLHVPIVPMSVKLPVAPMLYVETSFEPEFVT
jgi:hypothetical protein